MDAEAAARARQTLDDLYRTDARRVFATLVRLLGDFDLAEDALQDAFAAAAQRWPADGVPANPRAWLISAGRFKAIDAIRRRARSAASLPDLAARIDAEASDEAQREAVDSSAGVDDDRLRLIFTCCHPALPPEARIALTLREVCGLTTDEIARAFLTTDEIARAFLTAAPTLAQRIVRAKAKIRDAGIPYRVPSDIDIPDRLDAVLRVVYLVFNEGYAASSGDALTRPDLSGEAIRLGRLLAELMPEPEVLGLLALMVIQESRRLARTSPSGEIVLLEDQDRSLWNRELIAEGLGLVQRALQSRRYGSYTIQSTIAAVHAEADAHGATDWSEICGLYDILLRIEPSPVVELNRAVAVAMRDGARSGLALIDAILARGDLADYHLAHSARGELCRRLGETEEARVSYTQALALARQEPERRFIERRLCELSNHENYSAPDRTLVDSGVPRATK